MMAYLFAEDGSAIDERERQNLIHMIREMGQLVVPAYMYDRAKQLFPEVADKIICSTKIK